MLPCQTDVFQLCKLTLKAPQSEKTPVYQQGELHPNINEFCLVKATLGVFLKPNHSLVSNITTNQRIQMYTNGKGFPDCHKPCISVGPSVGLCLDPMHHHIQSSVTPTRTSQAWGAESPDPQLNHGKRRPVGQRPSQHMVWSQMSLNTWLWGRMRGLATGKKPVIWRWYNVCYQRWVN